MLDRWNQLFILLAKYNKPAMFIFKTMEHCTKTHDIKHINSRAVIVYNHQWKLEQKKTDNLKMPKVKDYGELVLHKLIRRMIGVPLAYVTTSDESLC